MMVSPCVFCKKEHEFSREEAFQILKKTSDSLRLLLDGVVSETFNHSMKEKWSPRQILIHLIDTEYAYGFRYRLIMGQEEPAISPYDQNAWVQNFTYGDLDATQLIRAFTPIRRVNLELLQSVDPELFERTGTHPEYGKISVSMMIPHIAAHDQNHLQQIRDRIPLV